MLHNCDMRIEGNILTLTIDLSHSGKPSANRRKQNRLIGSTGGTKPLVGEDGKYRAECINLSVWRASTPEEIAAETTTLGFTW